MFKATTHYAEQSVKGLSEPTLKKAACPIPGCSWIGTLTHNSTFPWHSNTLGFTCDSTGLSIAKAKNIQIDENGKLIGIDEMKKTDL